MLHRCTQLKYVYLVAADGANDALVGVVGVAAEGRLVVIACNGALFEVGGVDGRVVDVLNVARSGGDGSADLIGAMQDGGHAPCADTAHVRSDALDVRSALWTLAGAAARIILSAQ